MNFLLQIWIEEGRVEDYLKKLDYFTCHRSRTYMRNPEANTLYQPCKTKSASCVTKSLI